MAEGARVVELADALDSVKVPRCFRTFHFGSWRFTPILLVLTGYAFQPLFTGLPEISAKVAQKVAQRPPLQNLPFQNGANSIHDLLSNPPDVASLLRRHFDKLRATASQH